MIFTLVNSLNLKDTVHIMGAIISNYSFDIVSFEKYFLQEKTVEVYPSSNKTR